MTTETDLVNSALRRVGAQRITDITDSVGSAGIAQDILAQERDSLLRSGTWNFATTRALLAPLTEIPVFGFEHAYALPSNYMRLISVHPDPDTWTQTRYKLESILQNDDTYIPAILADESALYIRYVREVTTVDDMSADFQDLLILAMALVFAIAVAKSNELRAQIQAEYNKTEVSTRAVDGIEDMIDQADEGSWARSRRGRWWNSSLSQDWPR